jgi:hypothetical protein
MQRMGHDSVRAAMIHQHSTMDADRRIADAMNHKIKEAGEAAGIGSSATGRRNGTVVYAE